MLFLNPKDKLTVKINDLSLGARWSIRWHQNQTGGPVRDRDRDRDRHQCLPQTFIRGPKASSRLLLHPPQPVSALASGGSVCLGQASAPVEGGVDRPRPPGDAAPHTSGQLKQWAESEVNRLLHRRGGQRGGQTHCCDFNILRRVCVCVRVCG